MKPRKDSFLPLLLLALVLALSGCAQLADSFDTAVDYLGLGPTQPPVVATPVPTPAPVATPEIAPKNIELLWQVPNEPVEAYHLYLLDSRGEEKRHYRVVVTKLRKEDDATYGPVYRYTLPDALKGEATTIKIRAENRFGLSEPSEPMIVGE